MKFFRGMSLRLKVIGMVTFIIFLLGLGAWFSMVQVKKSYETEVMTKFSNGAVNLGLSLAAQFYERYGDVQAFALNPNVRALDGKKASSDLDEYVKLYGIYELIIVVDKNGKFITSNTKDTKDRPVDLKKLAEIDYSQTPWFQAAIKGETTDDKDKAYAGTYFEEFHVDPTMKSAFGDNRVMTGFTATIKDPAGNVIGVVSNRAATKWIDYETQAVYDDIRKQFGKVKVTLVNRDGLVFSDIRGFRPDQKSEVTYDLDSMFLKKDMRKLHTPVGQMLVDGKSGAVYSTDRDYSKEQEEVVGFHLIENAKWPSSIKWGVMIQDDREEALAAVTSAFHNFYLIFGFITFIALAVSVFFSVALGKSMNMITEILAKNSSEVSDASRKIADTATELSEASTEQAAALQETVAAVDEISAMVDKNAESANQSRENSNNSRQVAEKGKQIVSNMLRAIDEIDNSTNEVGAQVENSNKQLGEITKLINDIGSKTKVINEIVFQTKLLSFNASVEAARAGEYGKGFAVVAEEVGNLAQMSGNAAKEITDLLEQSVRRVETIVEDSRTKIERLMNQSRDKVKVGSQTANDCSSALEEILQNVATVDGLVSEIATASQEQASGIREISKAVGQMEIVIQKNSSVAQSSSVSAEQLSTQSDTLKGIVDDLVHIVQGASASLEDIHRPDSSSAKRPTKKPEGKVLKYEAKKPSKPTSVPTLAKKVAGSDVVPSKDDPGFGE